jgi:hypothetical protein
VPVFGVIPRTPDPPRLGTTPGPIVTWAEGRRGDTFILDSDGSGVTYIHAGKTDAVLLNFVREIDFIDGREVFALDDRVANIVRLYQAAFSREPDQAGLHYWSNALAPGASPQNLADNLLRSPEFTTRFGSDLSSSDYVTRLYQNVLGRAPDPPGLAYWKGILDNGTATRAQILAAVAESAENQAATASTIKAGIWDFDETAAQVARLYDTTLGRLPDEAGLGYWTQTTKAGGSLLDDANNFLNSTEFLSTYGTLDNRSFIATLYNNSLHRGADAQGEDYWINALNSGASRAQVVIGVSESPEHQASTAANIMPNNPADYGIRLA